jgi:hypothetical protein
MVRPCHCDPRSPITALRWGRPYHSYVRHYCMQTPHGTFTCDLGYLLSATSAHAPSAPIEKSRVRAATPKAIGRGTPSSVCSR